MSENTHIMKTSKHLAIATIIAVASFSQACNETENPHEIQWGGGKFQSDDAFVTGMNSVTENDTFVYRLTEFQKTDSVPKLDNAYMIMSMKYIEAQTGDTMLIHMEEAPSSRMIGQGYRKMGLSQSNAFTVGVGEDKYVRLTAAHSFGYGIKNEKGMAHQLRYAISEISDVAYTMDTLGEDETRPFPILEEVDLDNVPVAVMGWRLPDPEADSSLQLIQVGGVAHSLTDELRNLAADNFTYKKSQGIFFFRANLANDQPVNGLSGSPVYRADNPDVPVGVYSGRIKMVNPSTGASETYLIFAKIDRESLNEMVRSTAKWAQENDVPIRLVE